MFSPPKVSNGGSILSDRSWRKVDGVRSSHTDSIVDGVASEHVITRADYLFDVKQVHTRTIELPNRESVASFCKGNVKVDVGKGYPIFHKY